MLALVHHATLILEVSMEISYCNLQFFGSPRMMLVFFSITGETSLEPYSPIKCSLYSQLQFLHIFINIMNDFSRALCFFPEQNGSNKVLIFCYYTWRSFSALVNKNDYIMDMNFCSRGILNHHDS